MTKMWDDPVSAADMADEHAALIMARDDALEELRVMRADLAECERQRVLAVEELDVARAAVDQSRSDWDRLSDRNVDLAYENDNLHAEVRRYKRIAEHLLGIVVDFLVPAPGADSRE